MRAKAIAAVLTLGALGALALPTSSGAVSRHFRQPGAAEAELHLHGSRGFRLDVVHGPQGSLLSATKIRAEASEFIVYLNSRAPSGNPGERSLNVRIGRLGHFRGHLVVTSTKTERPENHCTGKPTIIERGVFVGSFRFRGEEDYTRAQASRAKGSITRRGAQTCVVSVPKHFPSPGRSPRGPDAKRPAGEDKLLAGDAAGTSFEVEHRDERSIGADFESVDFSASVSEKIGKLYVDHYIDVPSFGTELASVFQIPNLAEPLAEAVVTPPAPFSGSATFRSDGKKTGTWTGDLAVRLPGLPTTPLTSNGIEAGLCAGPAGCTETLPPELQPVLEAPPGSIVAVASKKRRR